MTTALDTDTSLDVLQALEFDPEIKCYVPSISGDGEMQPPCHNPAAVVVHHLCCGKRYPMCQDHHDASMPLLRAGTHCTYCREPIGPEWVTFTPVARP